jgi:hypothetical protein
MPNRFVVSCCNKRIHCGTKARCHAHFLTQANGYRFAVLLFFSPKAMAIVLQFCFFSRQSQWLPFCNFAFFLAEANGYRFAILLFFSPKAMAIVLRFNPETAKPFQG